MILSEFGRIHEDSEKGNGLIFDSQAPIGKKGRDRKKTMGHPPEKQDVGRRSPIFLNDVFGRITRIQLQMANNRMQAYMPEIIRSLESTLVDTTFYVVAEVEDRSFQTFSDRISILRLPRVSHNWSQDRKLILTDGLEHHLIGTPHFFSFYVQTPYVPKSLASHIASIELAIGRHRFDVANALDQVANTVLSLALGYRLNEVELGVSCLDGGNIVSDDKTIFLGKKFFDKNLIIEFWRAAKRVEKLVEEAKSENLKSRIVESMKSDKDFGRFQEFLEKKDIENSSQLKDELIYIRGIGQYFESYEGNSITRCFREQLHTALSRYSGGRELQLLDIKNELPKHLDMYLTPLGEGRILLGDYRMVRDSLLSSFGGQSIEGQSIADSIDRENSGYAEGLEDLADLLSPMYDVLKAPFCEGSLISEKTYGMLTFNNALIENYSLREGTRVAKAYISPLENSLKQGSLGTILKKGFDVYDRFGYELNFIRGAENLFSERGSVRCLAKVLARDDTSGRIDRKFLHDEELG